MDILQFVCLLLLTGLTVCVAAQAESRIINGDKVNIARHPYFVSLRYRRTKESAYMHECAGVIYSKTVVLTAAQCLARLDENTKLLVVAGSNSRTGTDGLIYHVASYTHHPKFDYYTADYDVGLVFLKSPLDFSNFAVREIEFRAERPAAGREALVTGWGYREEWGPSSENLEQVHVPIVSSEQCNSIYGAGEVTERMICAGDVEHGGRDACQGDTGGPLIIDEQLVGLVSWGRGCGRPGYPTVYCYVNSLKSWIDETIEATQAL